MRRMPTYQVVLREGTKQLGTSRLGSVLTQTLAWFINGHCENSQLLDPSLLFQSFS